jgi:lipopolysaccharide transport system ATP-binding protein
MPAIQVEQLSKRYRIYDRSWHKLRDTLKFRSKAQNREFWALQNVTFELEPGQTLGIIGQNGSGKSTLLQIMAGILRPTIGVCLVNGKISALLELGSGFNPEFTGRENVFMNGAILGMDGPHMKKRFEAVARFAEIGSFIEQPVKTYSSGMYLRLAFAVAVNVDPDILLVDEALAVGDLIFQHRCMHRMKNLRDAGKTIVLVTHDLEAVTKFCDRTLLLDGGHILEDGPPDSVVQKYRALIFERERRYGAFNGVDSSPSTLTSISSESEMPVAGSIPNIDHRFGSGEAELLGIELISERGESIRTVSAGQAVTVRISVRFNENVDRPILGYTLRDRHGVEITASNTTHAGQPLPAARKGQTYTSDFVIRVPPIAAGSYSISPAVAKGELLKHDMCDWIDNALIFSVRSDSLIYGMMKMDVNVKNYASD